MNLQKLLLCAGVYFLLSSCQKELEVPTTPVVPPPVDSSQNIVPEYLEQIYSIDSTAGVSDTIQYTLYGFDGQKRVIQQSLYTNGLFDSWTTYQYNGNDSLPQSLRKVSVENGASIATKNDTLNSYYFYTADGKNLSDSSIYNIHTLYNGQNIYQIQKTINQYQYESGKIFRKTSQQLLYSSVVTNMTPVLSVDTAETDNRNNIVTYKHYTIQSSGAMQFNFLYKYTYDQKFTPSNKLSIVRTFDPFPFSSKNNRLSIHYEFPGGQLDEDLSGRYVYNANGYPSRLIFVTGVNKYHIESYTYR